jgi:hypothetical protein
MCNGMEKVVWCMSIYIWRVYWGIAEAFFYSFLRLELLGS